MLLLNISYQAYYVSCSQFITVRSQLLSEYRLTASFVVLPLPMEHTWWNLPQIQIPLSQDSSSWDVTGSHQKSMWINYQVVAGVKENTAKGKKMDQRQKWRLKEDTIATKIIS